MGGHDANITVCMLVCAVRLQHCAYCMLGRSPSGTGGFCVQIPVRVLVEALEAGEVVMLALAERHMQGAALGALCAAALLRRPQRWVARTHQACPSSCNGSKLTIPGLCSNFASDTASGNDHNGVGAAEMVQFFKHAHQHRLAKLAVAVKSASASGAHVLPLQNAGIMQREVHEMIKDALPPLVESPMAAAHRAVLDVLISDVDTIHLGTVPLDDAGTWHCPPLPCCRVPALDGVHVTATKDGMCVGTTRRQEVHDTIVLPSVHRHLGCLTVRALEEAALVLAFPALHTRRGTGGAEDAKTVGVVLQQQGEQLWRRVEVVTNECALGAQRVRLPHHAHGDVGAFEQTGETPIPLVRLVVHPNDVVAVAVGSDERLDAIGVVLLRHRCLESATPLEIYHALIDAHEWPARVVVPPLRLKQVHELPHLVQPVRGFGVGRWLRPWVSQV